MLRALHVLNDLVPWSPHVAEVLREQVERPARAVRAYAIDSDPDWSVALIQYCGCRSGGSGCDTASRRGLAGCGFASSAIPHGSRSPQDGP